MTAPEPDFLSPSLRSAVASAGYRARRWRAARQVLGNRVTKNRIVGRLGEMLQEWGVGISPMVEDEGFQLTLGLEGNQLWWSDGPASQPLEQALLHLPALRGFWRQELRPKHFLALKSMVPKAWVKDEAPVPPGAVIHGLGIPSWDHLQRLDARIPSLVAEGRFIAERVVPDTRINAFYQRDGQRRVVLRSIEALS